MRCQSYSICICIEDCNLGLPLNKDTGRKTCLPHPVGNEVSISFGQRPLISAQSSLCPSTLHLRQRSMNFAISLCLNSVNAPTIQTKSLAGAMILATSGKSVRIGMYLSKTAPAASPAQSAPSFPPSRGPMIIANPFLFSSSEKVPC